MNIKIFFAGFALISANILLANEFEACPPQAVASLKITSPRKPVRTGYVFVNGKYLSPPYRVTRHGTVLKINGTQVTGQIIPWSRFLDLPQTSTPSTKAMPPVAKAKKTSTAPKKITSVDDLFADEPAAEEPTKSKTADSNAIDELFGDGPAKPPSSAEVMAEAIENATFVKTPKTDKLLKRINTYRSDVHRQLLDGDICFFGCKYSPINVPNKLARKFLDFLPTAYRESMNANEFYSMLRTQGFVFVSRQICDELFANIADSPKIQERRRKERSNEETQNILNKAR
jgi:hypothetical protein